MGVWGTQIFQNDLAMDVKEQYIYLLEEGNANFDITNHLIERYRDIEEEMCIFWFSLASIQWDYGRLLENVRMKALEYIKNSNDLEIWKNEKTTKEYLQRKKELKQLEDKLNSPMPKEKKITKKYNYVCQWTIGDVFAWNIRENSNYLVFVKIGEELLEKDTCPLIYVYNKIFTNIPKIEELININYLPQGYYPTAYKKGYEDVLYKCLLWVENSTREYLNNAKYIGNVKQIKKPRKEKNSEYEINNRKLCLVQNFEKEEMKSYEEWKNIKYS